jgi:hypothetical protein
MQGRQTVKLNLAAWDGWRAVSAVAPASGSVFALVRFEKRDQQVLARVDLDKAMFLDEPPPGCEPEEDAKLAHAISDLLIAELRASDLLEVAG